MEWKTRNAREPLSAGVLVTALALAVVRLAHVLGVTRDEFPHAHPHDTGLLRAINADEQAETCAPKPNTAVSYSVEDDADEVVVAVVDLASSSAVGVARGGSRLGRVEAAALRRDLGTDALKRPHAAAAEAAAA